MDNPFQSPVVLSLCPGILGLERGVERAIGKITVAAYVEIEAFCIANLVTAMESGFLDPVPIWSDVKTFNARPFRGRIHGVIGGYPCQPFSNAGLRRGEDDLRHLWPFIREIVRTTKPGWCFFENVRGHLTLGFDVVHRELSEMGYRVEAGIFSAQEVGATHQRERLFILALDNSYIDRFKQEYAVPARWNSAELTDTELGYTKSIREREPSNETDAITVSRAARGKFSHAGYELANASDDGQRSRTDEQSEDGGGRQQLVRTEPRRYAVNYCEDVANNTSIRSSTRIPEPGQWKEGQPKVFNNGSNGNWPAGQGPYQHEWEEPRAVEPGVGCSVDGYNFRTDLLRAYGNAVVEQTAELAFNTLLQKHFNETSYP